MRDRILEAERGKRLFGSKNKIFKKSGDKDFSGIDAVDVMDDFRAYVRARHINDPDEDDLIHYLDTDYAGISYDIKKQVIKRFYDYGIK